MHEFIAGMISGFVQTVIGHPFDTLKTWKQNKMLYDYPKLSIKNLYKGVEVPLIQTPLTIGSTLYVNTKLYEKTNNIYISSICSGIVSTFLYTPFDYIKIKKQQQQKYLFTKSFNKIHIVALHEIPANIMFFGTYYYFKNKNYNYYLSGALANVSCTLFIYPINTIKTRVQTNTSITFKQAFIKYNLYNGIQISLLRSIISGSIGFPIFEKLKSI